MGQVNVSVNKRSYVIACDDGQEERLRELAAYIDGHVADLAQSVGQAGDARLMLMAGLLIADELSDALARVSRLEDELQAVRAGGNIEDSVANVLQQAAGRIDALAEYVARR